MNFFTRHVPSPISALVIALEIISIIVWRIA